MSETIKIGNHELVHITEVRRLNQRVAELKGKLEMAQNDLAIRTSELEKAEEKLQRKQDAGDLIFEEIDDKTPEPNCSCFVISPCSDCTKHGRKRAALKAWKESEQ